jgi:membrane protease subunit HflC
VNRIGFIASSLLVLLVLLSSTLFVVDQRQFGVVYALGQIKEVITEPGLNFKLPPPFQNVSYIDKRLLTLDSTDPEPMLTAEKQRVVIDWYVRWRVSGPTEYIRNVGLDERAGALQLNRVVRNAFQEEINKRTVKDLLSLKREQLMADVKKEVQQAVTGAKPWGIDIVDVRITRVDYVEAITESVYRRMEAERKRVANELRSTGAAEGEKIRADADRQREITVAETNEEVRTVVMHDGASVRLRTTAPDYDPTNRESAYAHVRACQARGEIATGLLFVDENGKDMHDFLRTPATPLVDIPYEKLCPGKGALDKLMDKFR